MDTGHIATTLQSVTTEAVRLARRLGADQAEASTSYDEGFTVGVRMAQVETVRRRCDCSLSVTIYRDSKKGTATTSDFTLASVEETVRRAVGIGRFTEPDPCLGLAEPALLATNPPDLRLYFPWDIDVEGATALARRAEDAAWAYDERIVNSDGAQVSTSSGHVAYANSHGFIGGYPKTMHSVTCRMVAKAGASLERDYWYSVARSPDDLDTPENVGIRAARRAVLRLHPRELATRVASVIFPAELSRSLFEHFAAALQGTAQYRRASFFAGAAGEQVLPSFLRVDEDPLIPRGAASVPFDGEGVATRRRALVTNGTLQGYMLTSYSARRLGLTTTGNSGGSHNLLVHSNAGSLEDIVAGCSSAFVAGEFLGQGVNVATGSYSRGAAGFWVERGEIVHPVSDVTIAGRLPDIFRQIAAVGSDVDARGMVRCGAVLVEGLTIGGRRK
jgi:PmbA protein